MILKSFGKVKRPAPRVPKMQERSGESTSHFCKRADKAGSDMMGKRKQRRG